MALDATGSTDPDTTDTLTHEWSGPGAEHLDDTTSPTPTFEARTAPGIYDLTLTVDDGNGGTHSADTIVRVLSTPRPQPDDPALGVAEVSRFEAPDLTSAAVQAALERGAPNGMVVLARVDVFADALAGSVYLADAPLLFTPRDALRDDVHDAITQLLDGGGEVIVLGGPTAISNDITDLLAADGHLVTRLFGPSRVETSVEIANDATRRYGIRTWVGLARAYDEGPKAAIAWADSVAAGGWSASTRSPILLTMSETLHPAVGDWLNANAPDNRTVLGGTAAITESVRRAAGGTDRVAGSNRYATSVTIADQLVNPEAASYLITSGNHPDGWGYALIGAGHTADTGNPLLLSGTEDLPDEVDAATCSTGTRTPTHIMGGTEIVSEAVADALAGACQTDGDV